MPERAADIVYSIAVGLPAKLAEPFVRSFRRHNSTARVVIGIGRGESEGWAELRQKWSVETRELGARFKVRRVPGGRAYGLLEIASRNALFRRALLARLPDSAQHRAERLRRIASVTAGRFCWYYLWLQTDRPDRIVMADVRDVVFQADVFSQQDAWGPRLWTGQENKLHRDDALNQRWLRMIGWSDLPIQERAIICSGATLGTRPVVERYLEEMIAVMIESGSLADGVDQAMHNVVVYSRLANVAFSRNGEGPIYTAGYVPESEAVIRDGALRNEDGSIVPIVHQYDRWSAEVQQRLGAVGDARVEGPSAGEPVAQGHELRHGDPV